jgi:hypothetical protein
MKDSVAQHREIVEAFKKGNITLVESIVMANAEKGGMCSSRRYSRKSQNMSLIKSRRPPPSGKDDHLRHRHLQQGQGFKRP